MNFKTHIGNSITDAARFLKSGELVGMPTETVYGLAGNAFDTPSVLKIFETKNRPTFDPLIVHTDSIEKIAHFAHLNERALALFEQFSPGPLTILLPRKAVIPDLVTSGLPRVAVRLPKHPMALELLKNLNFPLAAPSANPFGYISPTTAQHVFDQLGGKIPYILDGGACAVGVESTILSFDDAEKCFVHRLGGLSLEAIERVVGHVNLAINNASNPSAPGMLLTHYAPRKPLYLADFEADISDFTDFVLQKTGLDSAAKKVGLVYFGDKKPLKTAYELEKNLSETGDLAEAAQNLFAILRGVDASAVDIIIAQRVPDAGLGKAVNDRLWRAATHI